MARQSSDDVQEEVAQQDEEVYGNDFGTSRSEPIDTEEMVEEVIGNPPKSGQPFSIADEVRKDELALRNKRPKKAPEEKTVKVTRPEPEFEDIDDEEMA